MLHPLVPKIVLFGSDGQVGLQLRRSLSLLGKLVALTRKDCDLSHSIALENCLEKHAPDIIVNAAAYTSVDLAETERNLANAINHIAPDVMAKYARTHNAILVHYSTDYVFDGSKSSAYFEADTTNPINVYGETKRLGESAIEASGCDYWIFRTSWVYGVRGTNFARTILRLAKERSTLYIIDDQKGVPTSAELIADATAHALQSVLYTDTSIKSGIYHLVPDGETTWYHYAREVVNFALSHGQDLQCNLGTIIPINSEEFPTKAKRPKNSVLNNTKLKSTFDIYLVDWKVYLHRALEELVSVR